MGKSIGGTLGLPPEGKTERLNFTFYDPIPTIAPPNDDLELQLVWLELIEKGGAELTRKELAGGWLRNIHYMWDEYGRCRWNLRRGVPVELNGTFENPFHGGMGSPIRSEIWATLFMNDPSSAGYYAALDASLDHGVEGIAGEVFFAVMQSHVCAGVPLVEAIQKALTSIPASSETASCIAVMCEGHRNGVEMWKLRDSFLAAHNNENFTHAPLNVGLAVWALLYGNGDFGASILLSVNAGYDTDSTAATVGATLGLALGIDGIPAKWREPIGDGVYLGPGIRDLDGPPLTLVDLTRRVGAAAGKLEPVRLESWNWTEPKGDLSSLNLPGTISIQEKGGSPATAWSNGEMPQGAKAAGGASWTWNKECDEPRNIICLAREGARLFVDDKLVVECPPSLPFVPATHRCAPEARKPVQLSAGAHEVRVELTSKNEKQDVAVMLTYPNLHLCPWTAAELAHAAVLPGA